MKFKTGLKGFWSILFGVIVIALLVVGSIYFINLPTGEASTSTDETTQEEGDEGGNEDGNEGGNADEGDGEPGSDEAIQIEGNNTYIYRID